MTEEKRTTKGLKIGKEEKSSVDMIRENMPHWIHDTRRDENSLTGVIYLPGCTCSECGFHVNIEKRICPHCKVRMMS